MARVALRLPLLAPLALGALLIAADAGRHVAAGRAVVGAHLPRGVVGAPVASRPRGGARRLLSSAMLLAGLPRSLAEKPMSKEELQQVFGRTLADSGHSEMMPYLERWWDGLWEKADISGDGILSTAELEYFVLLSEETAAVAKWRAFGEGVPLMDALAEVQPPLHSLAELDIDGDGLLGREEIVAGAPGIVAHSIGAGRLGPRRRRAGHASRRCR